MCGGVKEALMPMCHTYASMDRQGFRGESALNSSQPLVMIESQWVQVQEHVIAVSE